MFIIFCIFCKWTQPAKGVVIRDNHWVTLVNCHHCPPNQWNLLNNRTSQKELTCSDCSFSLRSRFSFLETTSWKPSNWFSNNPLLISGCSSITITPKKEFGATFYKCPARNLKVVVCFVRWASVAVGDREWSAFCWWPVRTNYHSSFAH